MRFVPQNCGSRLLLYFLLGAFASLYLKSFILPRTPIYQGDSSPIFLTEAVRMFQGQIIYRDFFELTLPGTQVAYLTLYKLFGIRSWIPSSVFVLLGVGLAWMGVAISKGIMRGKSVLLPSLLFLAFSFTSEPDPTHHWFNALAVMGALGLLINKRTPWRLAGAGALCGLATLFTQTKGVAAVVGLAAFLIWEVRSKGLKRRSLLKAVVCLFGSFLAITLAEIAHLIGAVGLERLTYCIGVFPLKYFSLWYWNTPRAYLSEVPNLSGILEAPALGIWLSIHILVPLIYVLFLVRWSRVAKTHPEEPWAGLMLLSLVGLFLFLSVASSPSWLRLCSGSLPALVVFVWFVKSSGRLSQVFMTLLWAAGISVLVAQCLIAQTDTRAYLDSRVGRLAFLEPERYEKFKWVQDHTHQDDFLFQASDSDMYYPLGLRNPTPVQFLTASGYTRPEQVREVVKSLERYRVRFVLWSVWLDIPRHPGFNEDNLASVRTYLDGHYHLVRNFGDPDYEQVWERNPD